MNLKIRRIKMVTLLAGLIALVGCDTPGKLPPGAGAAPGPLPPPIAAQPNDNGSTNDDGNKPAPAPTVTVTLATNTKTYRRGDIATLTITARNSGKSAQTLEFGSGQDFDLTATPLQGGAPVWTWSDGRMFTMVFRTVRMAPGGSRMFVATWEQNGNDGNTAPRGTYNVVAKLATNPAITSAPITIELTD